MMSQDPKDLRRCTRCILPETFPGIKFNEKGVCNYCLNYKPAQVLGEKELEKILSRFRNKGEKYDCVVACSGGRDSTFVLHQIVKKYKMRAVAVTVDTGLITPEGIRNIRKATKILNVDHVLLKDEKRIKIAKQNMRIKFQSWLKRPSINTIVPVLNSGDKTLNLQIYKFIKENKIPLFIGGKSSFEQEHFKTGFMGVFPDERGVYSIWDRIKLLFLFGYEYIRDPNNFRPSILKEYTEGAAMYFFESIFKPKNVVWIDFYDYVEWNEKKILSTIQNELDWKGASDTSTTWRVDDGAYPLINYIYYKLVGFTEHDEIYSKMIRAGQISREEALERCLSDQKPRIPSIMRILEELGVTKEQLDEVLEKYREKLWMERPWTKHIYKG